MGQKMPVVRIDLSACARKPAWYTVVTIYNYEKKYAEDLMKGLKNSGLEDKIVDVVVPIRETKYTTTTKTGKISEKVKIEKVMPLYVFVKAIMDEQVWEYLRNLTGAHTILAAGGCPSIMDDSDIHRIKDVCGLLEKEKKTRKEDFDGQIGDTVEIVSGPFQTYKGTIKEINRNKGIVKIVLENGLPVEVDVGDVEVV